jgi:hypothetical protein
VITSSGDKGENELLEPLMSNLRENLSNPNLPDADEIPPAQDLPPSTQLQSLNSARNSSHTNEALYPSPTPPM